MIWCSFHFKILKKSRGLVLDKVRVMVVGSLVLNLCGADDCWLCFGPVDEPPARNRALEAVVDGQREDIPDQVERLEHTQKKVGHQVSHDCRCPQPAVSWVQFIWDEQIFSFDKANRTAITLQNMYTSLVCSTHSKFQMSHPVSSDYIWCTLHRYK